MQGFEVPILGVANKILAYLFSAFLYIHGSS